MLKKKKKKKIGGLPGGLGKNGISTALHLKMFWPPPPHPGLFCNNQSLKITGVRPVKIKIPLSRHEWNLTSLDSIGNWMFTLLTDCWSWDSHLIFWGMLVIYHFYFCIGGARWLSGRVSDSGARGRFETYRRRVVSLSKTLYSPKVLVNYPGSGGSVPTWLKNCWLGR